MEKFWFDMNALELRPRFGRSERLEGIEGSDALNRQLETWALEKERRAAAITLQVKGQIALAQAGGRADWTGD